MANESFYDFENFSCGSMNPKENSSECCCNCKFQIELTGHPWTYKNTGTTIGYVCIAQHEIEPGSFRGMLNSKHGMCELYDKRGVEEIEVNRIIDNEGNIIE